jgi:hypothetical protein
MICHRPKIRFVIPRYDPLATIGNGSTSVTLGNPMYKVPKEPSSKHTQLSHNSSNSHHHSSTMDRLVLEHILIDNPSTSHKSKIFNTRARTCINFVSLCATIYPTERVLLCQTTNI